MYENLKAEMVRKNLTMSQLGKQCGMTLQKMSSRMNGKTPFIFDETLKIRDVLKVEMPLETLFQKEVNND